MFGTEVYTSRVIDQQKEQLNKARHDRDYWKQVAHGYSIEANKWRRKYLEATGQLNTDMRPKAEKNASPRPAPVLVGVPGCDNEWGWL